MKHASQTQFGRPDRCVQTTAAHSTTLHDGTPPDLCDKWEVLSLLTDAAPAYGLSHRTLSVLRALLTFLPTRTISPLPQDAIVFPANKTLSARLNGMPESTLRRHLAQLVRSGVVSRHDSANRKRFARRSTQVGQIAFGFDLSPLVHALPDITRAADERRRALEEVATLRAHLASLRQALIARIGDTAFTDSLARALRRKLGPDDLSALCTSCAAHLDQATTEKTSVTDSQNERHIQIENITISDAAPDQSTPHSSDMTPAKKTTQADLDEIVETCREYKSYFPEAPRNWHDIVSIADRLVPMIGIERPVFDEAIRYMGLQKAATVVLCILDRLPDLRNPGGFLRRLTQITRSGQDCFAACLPKTPQFEGIVS